MSARPGQPRRRRALLLGCSEFTDPSLPSLQSPATDVRALATVLQDPNGSNYEVTSEINIASHEAQLAIDRFLDGANTQDLHLIYFTGHGIQDARGSLFFACTNTDARLPSSTAVSADWIRDRVNDSRSRSTVILLDCCFSGLFLRGMRGRAAGTANVASLVGDLPEGSGIAILTASGETEFSLEDLDNDHGVGTRPSYFTEALVTGIGSGDADIDGDGRITVDELYDYVYARLKEGPSPQRPRKMGVGEGHVVVALTTPRPAPPTATVPRESPPSPRQSRPHQPTSASAADTATVPSTVEITGLLGKVAFDGASVTITKNGYGPRMNGTVQLPIEQITAVTVKPATALVHGYIQFTVRTQPAAPIVRVGLAAGRPHREDPLSLSFPRKRNDAIRDFQKQVEAALSTRPPPDGPDADTTVTTTGRRSRTPTPPAFHRSAIPENTPTAEPRPPDQGPPIPTTPSTAMPVSPAVEVDPAVVARSLTAQREAERRQGHTDATAAATNIPFQAWASLVASGYDIVRWIEPWLQRWQMIRSGQAAPDPHLAKWLPELTHHLNPSAAQGARGTNASMNYLEGFTAGIRDTWHTAVRERLLPPTPHEFDRWLRTPTQPPFTPPALLTIADLRKQVRQTRRNKTAIVVLRVALWTLAALFALLEIGAIGVTVTGGWQPNNTSSRIIGNLMFAIPLAALIIALVFDTQQISKQSRPLRDDSQTITPAHRLPTSAAHIHTTRQPP